MRPTSFQPDPSKFIVAVLSVVGTAIVLLWMHWQLALFILSQSGGDLPDHDFGRRVKRLKAHEQNPYQAFQESLEVETLDAIQQIVPATVSGFMYSGVIDAAGKIRRSFGHVHLEERRAANWLSFMVFLFGFDIFQSCRCWDGPSTLIWSIGEILAVYAYLWFMMTPVQET